jgi:hypothetical protein
VQGDISVDGVERRISTAEVGVQLPVPIQELPVKGQLVDLGSTV